MGNLRPVRERMGDFQGSRTDNPKDRLVLRGGTAQAEAPRVSKMSPNCRSPIARLVLRPSGNPSIHPAQPQVRRGGVDGERNGDHTGSRREGRWQ